MKKISILLASLFCLAFATIKATEVEYHFQEGFTQSTPAGWKRTSSSTNTAVHNPTPPLPFAGAFAAKFDATCINETFYLETPEYPNAGTLSFYIAKNANNTLMDLHVVKVVNGISTEILSFDAFTAPSKSATWKQISIPVNEDKKVKFKFYSTIREGNAAWFSIDDIELTKLGTLPEPSDDAVEKINTNFGDGTWGTPFSTATGNYQTTVINGFQLQNAVLITGSLACSTGETHTSRIQLDKKANGGAIEFPLLKTVGEVEIHANAGTAGNPFALEIWENNAWNVVGTYSTLKGTDSIYIIPLEREVETKLRIANASGGGIVVYKIATRSYQESQELNITSTTPADGTTCYYNLTPNIVLTLNREVELGTTPSILLNNESIELNASMINGKTVTIPVTLESTTLGKSYIVTIPAGTFKEKDNVLNLSNEKIFSFATVKTVAYPNGYASQIDVAYSSADPARNRMDIYYPSTTTRSAPVPVVINIHGGGWNHGEKEAQGGFNLYFGMGFAVANVEYRLTSDATAPAAVEDVRCAMKYLLAHASELNIDPNKIIFQGGSAGAHLTLVAAYMLKDEKFDADCNPYSGDYSIIAVIDKYGPSKLDGFMYYSSLVSWLGDKKDDIEFVQSVSPFYLVSSDTPPTYIIHGDADPTVPYSQSEVLAQKLTEAGVKHQFTTVPGGGHGGFPAEYNTRMNEEITAFLTEVLDDTPLSLTPDTEKANAFYTQEGNKVYINIDGTVNIEIINLNGQLIQSTSAKEFSLTDKGLFILKVTAKDKVYTQKILNQ